MLAPRWFRVSIDERCTTVKLESLRVRNLRAISRFEVSDLGPFVVVAGQNGSGKSCIRDEVNGLLVRSINLGGAPQTASLGEELEKSLLGTLNRISILGNELTVQELNSRANLYRTKYEDALKADEWLKEFPGRLILRRFVSRVLIGKIDPLLFCNAILNKMVEKRVQPEGMKQVLDEILALN